jgi:3-oxoacyl-[acyl-carrier protein] reductase
MKVLIVGGSSSIGRHVVGAFRADDHHVESPSSEVLDVTDSSSIRAYFGCFELGLVDVAIFLPGLCPGQPLERYTDSEMDRAMGVNATGIMKTIRALLPHLADGSHILLTSSISAERGSYDPVYAAGKAALVGLSKSLATHLAPRVRVNVVSPGLVEGSAMYNDMSKDRQDFHRASSPTRQLLQGVDLAKIFVDITKPHWRHLNGAVLSINGGAHV